MKNILAVILILSMACTGLLAQDEANEYPVSLSSFEAGITNSKAVLKWKTVCYLSFAKFQIQKSYDGTNFSTIHTFSADRLRCQQPFDFTDERLSSRGNVFYRINAGDVDGNYFQSRVSKVVYNPTGNDFIAAYPNVVSSIVNIVLSVNKDSNLKLQLVNSAGMVVRQVNYKAARGISNLLMNIGGVANGKYWLISYDTQGQIHRVNIIKQ